MIKGRPESYPGEKKDRWTAIAAIAGAALTAGVVGINTVQSHESNKRPACIDIPVRGGDGPVTMLQRFDKAGLEPSGMTVVFKVNGDVLSAENSFPSHNGSSKLAMNDIIGVEHADPIACVDPLVGGRVSAELIDKQ